MSLYCSPKMLVHAHTLAQLLGLACVYVWREVAFQGLHSHWVCNDEVYVTVVTVGSTTLKLISSRDQCPTIPQRINNFTNLL